MEPSDERPVKTTAAAFTVPLDWLDQMQLRRVIEEAGYAVTDKTVASYVQACFERGLTSMIRELDDERAAVLERWPDMRTQERR